MYDHESIPIEACVVDTIPATHSSASMREIKQQSFFCNLKLADPDYTPAARIDVLLSIGDANNSLKTGVAISPDKNLHAEDSIFKWTVGGGAIISAPTIQHKETCLKVFSKEDAVAQLQNIWQMDDIPCEDSSLRPEEQSCVRHFQDIHQRQHNGRYVIKLPRKDDTPVLGR